MVLPRNGYLGFTANVHQPAHQKLCFYVKTNIQTTLFFPIVFCSRDTKTEANGTSTRNMLRQANETETIIYNEAGETKPFDPNHAV